MIYELRCYDIRPTRMQEALARFAEGLPQREKFSRPAAVLYTEIGTLNRIYFFWPYENEAERSRIREVALKGPHWPPQLEDLLLSVRSEIYSPVPFVEQFPAGQHGPIFELRDYLLRPDSVPNTMERWKQKFEPRNALSPCVAAMYSQSGILDRFIHLWGYRDLNHRMETRAKAIREGLWPPEGGAKVLLRQESQILLPADCSALK